MLFYLKIFLIISLTSAIFTLLIKFLAQKWGIVDLPDKDRIVKTERKIHKKKIPLLGGLAIFFSFFLGLFFVQDILVSGDLESRHWLGFFAGACFLMLGGFLDDKYNLRPSRQIIWPLLAILCVLIGGVEIAKITNPLGGLWQLDQWKMFLFSWQEQKYYFFFVADTLIILWLLGMMYTTKILDGLDGLVSGVVAIGALIIFLFTLSANYYQPDIALAALIFAAAVFGFLIFNWHPAKIFLGEGGALFLGYVLGVLAIISGGKIAIALLIMGIPILDVLFSIIRRLLSGKNPFLGDRLHLHHRLLDVGLGQRKTVLIFYLFALSFGLSALFLQSRGKLLALLLLISAMALIIIFLTRKNNYHN